MINDKETAVETREYVETTTSRAGTYGEVYLVHPLTDEFGLVAKTYNRVTGTVKRTCTGVTISDVSLNDDMQEKTERLAETVFVPWSNVRAVVG